MSKIVLEQSAAAGEVLRQGAPLSGELEQGRMISTIDVTQEEIKIQKGALSELAPREKSTPFRESESTPKTASHGQRINVPSKVF